MQDKYELSLGWRLGMGLIFTVLVVPGVLLVTLVVVGETWQVYHQVQHNLEIRHWPQQIAVISQGQVELTHGPRGSFRYAPNVLINYRFGATDYRHVRLAGELGHTSYIVSQKDCENYMQRFYPVGSQIKVLIDPQHPDMPRSINELDNTMPWSDVLVMVFLWVVFPIFLLAVTALFQIMMRRKNDSNAQAAPVSKDIGRGWY